MYIDNAIDKAAAAGFIKGYELNYSNIVELVTAYGDSPFMLADRAARVGYYLGVQAAKNAEKDEVEKYG